MAAFSLRVVAPIGRYHVYKETFESSLVDRVTFERHNGRRLPYHHTYSAEVAPHTRNDFLTMLCKFRQLFAATTHWIILVLEVVGIDEASLLHRASSTMCSSQAPHR